jgi:putative hydrolase of the HAD superfamily
MDAGGLLFNNVTEETEFLPALARRHGADSSELRRQLDRRDSGYETGTRHVHEVLADCLTAAGAKANGLEQEWADALYLESVRAYEAAFEALRQLRSERPDLVLALANNEAEHWDQLKNARYGHLALFDIVGSSWRLGAVKPGPEYFDRLLAACGCVPAEAVLVDDNPGNVDGARRFGMASVHITGPAELPAALAALNIGQRPAG